MSGAHHATLYTREGQIERRIVLDAQPLTIGRATDNDIVLLSPVVSAHHACIEPVAGGRHRITDLGSTNGLLCGGQRLTGEFLLHHGDVLRIGDPELGSFVSLTYENPQLLYQAPLHQHAIQLHAHNLSYQVGQGATAKTLLQPTSLQIAAGSLVAIIGASGAGKSTLLKALCGYQPATNGSVLINGQNLYANPHQYRMLLGYLPQHDTLYPQLTVAQALHFAARLRRAGGVPAARIDEVLALVDLEDYRHQFIGTLSGGQRKRAAIAAELLIQPALLFLDEPASGLDPGLEQKLMYTLRRIADTGCGVVLVTHATENIWQCDQVVLLAHGYTTYAGAPAEALDYFDLDSQVFADMYRVVEGRVAVAPLVEPHLPPRLLAAYRAWQDANPAATQPPWSAELWAHLLPPPSTLPPASAPPPMPPQPGWFTQTITLLQRTLLLKWQDRRYFWLLLAQAPLIGVLLLLVTPPDALLGTQQAHLTQRSEARELIFALVLASIWIGLLNAAREFAANPAILRHDWFSGIRPTASLTARLGLLALLGILQTVVLLGIVALRIPFPPDPGVLLPLPLESGITLLLATWAATMLGLFVGATTAGSERTAGIVPLLLVIQIVFSGLLFPAVAGMPAILSHLTISRPAVDAFGASLDLNTYCDLPNDVITGGGRPPIACSMGTLRLRPDPAFEHAFLPTRAHLLHNWLALVGFGGLCVLGAVVALWWQNRGLRLPALFSQQHRPDAQLASSDPHTPPARSLPPEPPDDGDRQAERTLLLASADAAQPTDATLSSDLEPTMTVQVGVRPEQTTVRIDQADTMTQDFCGDPSMTFDMSDDIAAASDRPPLRPSDQTQMISRYLIERDLGSRGIFTVYRAYDPVMRRQVAIKVLQKQYCTTLFNARFQQEVGLLAALEHPAIVPVYDYGEIEGQPFMVMQFIDGGALLARISRGAMPLQELVPVVDRMAAALDAAHMRGIVHQNLKPANILFNASNDAFLTDFGIQISAEMIADLSPTGIFDVNYLSPEQLVIIQRLQRGDAPESLHVPASSDVYALAAVVLHALTGEPVFPAPTPEESVQAHLYARLPQLRERNRRLPAACQPVFELALAKDPARRYPTAGAFAQDFREMARGRWFLSRLTPDGRAQPSEQAAAIEELDAAPPPPPDSARIGRYLIERPVGQGGMAMVYLAYDPLTKRRVAIKVLTDQLTGMPTFSERFRKEAEMVAALEHESIIRVYDLGEHEGQPFIVMQYLPGGTLADRFHKQRMRVSEFMPIMERLVSGLTVAHERAIIHQDIKPSNILFNRDGNAVLSDFGIAAAVEASSRRTRRRSFGGTPRYMSPEQARVLVAPHEPPPPISPQSDVYSLGVVLFQALTGRVPYDGRSVAEIALAHLQDPIPNICAINPLLPPYAQQVLARALAKQSDDRYPDVAEFAEAVRALADGSWALRQIDDRS